MMMISGMPMPRLPHFAPPLPPSCAPGEKEASIQEDTTSDECTSWICVKEGCGLEWPGTRKRCSCRTWREGKRSYLVGKLCKKKAAVLTGSAMGVKKHGGTQGHLF